MEQLATLNTYIQQNHFEKRTIKIPSEPCLDRRQFSTPKRKSKVKKSNIWPQIEIFCHLNDNHFIWFPLLMSSSNMLWYSIWQDWRDMNLSIDINKSLVPTQKLSNNTTFLLFWKQLFLKLYINVLFLFTIQRCNALKD